MRKLGKRALALLLVLLICVSMLSAGAMAVEVEDMEGVVSSEATIVTTGDDSMPLEAGAGENGAIPTEEGAEVFPDDSYGGILEGGNDILGGSEQLGLDELGTAGLIEDDSALGIDPDFQEELPDDAFEELPEDSFVDLPEDSGEAGDTETLSMAAAGVSFQRSALTLSKGKSAEIRIRVSNVPKGAKLAVIAWKNVITRSDSVSCRWGSGNNSSGYPLTISGQKSGVSYVYVYLLNWLGLPVAKAKLTVTVCEPKLTVAQSTVHVKAGNQITVNATATGFSGASEIYITTNNKAAYSCWTGKKSGNTVPIYIKGLHNGSGTIVVYYRAKNTQDVLATKTITVNCTETQSAKMSLSASSVNLKEGGSQQMSLTISGYSGSGKLTYGSTNTSVCQMTWKGISGRTAAFSLKGLKAGSCTITIYLWGAGDTLLATAKITVRVSRNSTVQPSVTPSKTSVSLKAGSSVRISFTVQNKSGLAKTYGVRTSSPATCTAKCGYDSSGFYAILNGVNAGKTTVYLYLKDAQGNEIASAPVAITVTAEKPKLTASASSVTVNKGASQKVHFAYSGCSEDVYFQCSRPSNSCVSVSWSKRVNNGIDLYVRGNAAGSETMTINLIRTSDRKVLTSVSLKVSVPSTRRLDIYSLSYNFRNYSTKISLKNYERIFGTKNQKAKTLQKANEKKAHGVCFGMATSASLLYTRDVAVSGFGASKPSGLTASYKGRTNSALGITLADFVEMMYTTQMAGAMIMTEGTDRVAKAIMSELDNGRPVCITLMGAYAHEVMAYGYSLSGNTLTVDIYDNNFPLTRRVMTIQRPASNRAFNTWSYQGGRTYQSSTHRLMYSTASTVSYVWANRGNYKAISNTTHGRNMIYCSEKDFTLYTMDLHSGEEKVVAKYVDGVLQEGQDVIEVPLCNADDETYACLIYVPMDYYFVQDDDLSDGIYVAMASENLAAEVETDSKESFGICADDASEAVSVSLNPAVGESYQITLSSSLGDEPQTVTTEGIGCGVAVNPGIQAGTLSLGEGVDNAEVDIAAMEQTYEIDVQTQAGVQVDQEALKTYLAGENALYRFTVQPGYRIGHVYVDGIDQGAVTSYYFEDVEADHTIVVETQREISDCTVQVDQAVFRDEQTREAAVRVTDPEGRTLTLFDDYTLAFEDREDGSVTVLVLAAEDGSYCGLATRTVQTETSAVRTVNWAAGTLTVELADTVQTDGGLLRAAFYTEQGQMLSVLGKQPKSDDAALTFQVSAAVQEQAAYVRLFWLDAGTNRPRSACFEWSLQ